MRRAMLNCRRSAQIRPQATTFRSLKVFKVDHLGEWCAKVRANRVLCLGLSFSLTLSKRLGTPKKPTELSMATASIEPQVTGKCYTLRVLHTLRRESTAPPCTHRRTDGREARFMGTQLSSLLIIISERERASESNQSFAWQKWGFNYDSYWQFRQTGNPVARAY